ncbi:tRNA synthetases class I (C) catalytic domain-containing protein [Phlyctochytrium arcticum]|nr:tRNA synthetases class I (C) catalytic domain-containing protein [Phlyctochytrium arcticum]
MSSTAIKQPEWLKPAGSAVPKLKISNSMTKSKEEFIPISGKSVGWYSCGPTVYDKSHMGHARAYITFDILRRIMEDYFNYDVFYVMNITDIDDKIIREARYKFLFEKLKTDTSSLSKQLIHQVQEAWTEYVKSKFKTNAPTSLESLAAFVHKYQNGGIPEAAEEAKYDLYVKTAVRAADALQVAQSALKAGNASKADADTLLDASRDIVAGHLDSRYKETVTDPKIFRDFAAFWEAEYFRDMDALNIKRPDVLTRVSEYVPEIVTYIERIIENGYAYEAGGSVYFNTVKFDKAPNHDYAKLEPWSAGNTKLMQEGEGELTADTQGKKNPADFALWKGSRSGEPAWPSPWGAGRPGWHIECSAMASEVLGQQLDIHSGGIDLAFPHHDNELAQSEGHYDCSQWVNYFIHAGHLHIEGQKMSKSLKNFVTIQDALKENSAAQIRIMFLLHKWDATLDFGRGGVKEAKSVESAIQNFLANVKAVVREQANSYTFTGAHNYREAEKDLVTKLRATEQSVHAALCDSFDTPTAFNALRELVSTTNTYYQDCLTAKRSPNGEVVAKVGKYVSRMLRVFGVMVDANPEVGESAGAGTTEETVMPYLYALSTFRDQVRELAQQKGDHKELLQLCDKLRDEDMVELGVALDDREDGKALVKLVPRETLLSQREEKRAKELANQQQKADRLAALEAKRVERLLKGKTPPSELFKTDEFKEWDERGLPVTDKDGEAVTKSRRKKMEKEWSGQEKLHSEYLAAREKGEI